MSAPQLFFHGALSLSPSLSLGALLDEVEPRRSSPYEYMDWALAVELDAAYSVSRSPLAFAPATRDLRSSPQTS